MDNITPESVIENETSSIATDSFTDERLNYEIDEMDGLKDFGLSAKFSPASEFYAVVYKYMTGLSKILPLAIRALSLKK